MEGLDQTMFTNLQRRNLTWQREPILWVALAVAVLQAVASGLSGDLAWADAIEAIVVLLFGFIARGQVVPVSKLHPDVVRELS